MPEPGIQDGEWVRIMPADGLLAAVHHAIAEPNLPGEGLLALLGIVREEDSDQLPHPLVAVAYELNNPRARVSDLEERLNKDFAGNVGLGPDLRPRDDLSNRHDRTGHRVPILSFGGVLSG